MRRGDDEYGLDRKMVVAYFKVLSRPWGDESDEKLE
jgi:hypothetical protein